MSENWNIERQSPFSKKKRDLLFIIFVSAISLSTLIYYNFDHKSPEIPPDLPNVYVTCQHRIRRYDYRDCVIDVNYESTISEIRYRGVYNYHFPKKEYRLQKYCHKTRFFLILLEYKKMFIIFTLQRKILSI